MWGGDDQDVLDPGEHERRQGVVDHRLVVDGHQLLRGAQGDGIQASAGAAGQDNSAHRYSIPQSGSEGGIFAASRHYVRSVQLGSRLPVA